MSKSIKEQIIEKTLTVKYDLIGAFENFKKGNINFEEFMEVIEKSGDRLTLAYDAFMREYYSPEEQEDPMAYEYWREREEEQEREAMINYIKEKLEK